MITKVISLKDYRSKITFLWKEAKKQNIRYIVLYHSKPILDVKPFKETELIFEDQNEQNAYYKTLEQNLNFWNKTEDDNIFSID